MNEYVEQHQVTWKQICFFLLLIASLGFQLLVPTNPDNVLPLLPECFSLICLIAACGFAFSDKQSFSLSKAECLFLLGVLVHHVLVLTPRAFLAFKDIPYQQWIPCASLGPSVVRQECFFHSAYNHHFALRQWSTLSFAITFGGLLFIFARGRQWVSSTVFAAMMTVSVGISLLSIAGYLGWQISVLPDWIYLNNYGNFRSTQIFVNPSWTWPYLLACLLASIYLAITSEIKLLRTFAVLSAFLTTVGIFLTQQRGGFVIVNITLVYFLILIFQRRSVASYVFILAVFFAVVWLLRNPNLIFGDIWQKGAGSMVSNERVQIWLAALDMFKQNPWVGYGYASWFAIISFLGRTEGFSEVYPTAHNFFVQLFVELGAIQGLLVCGLLFFGFFLLYSHAQTKKLKLFVVYSTVSLLILMLVQEVDYIRPIFYAHSFFWGTLLGVLCPKQSNRYVVSFRKAPAFTLLGGLASVQFGIAFYVYTRWARGAYAFEASASHANTPITRWVYKDVSLPVYVQHNLAYRIHPIYFVGNAGSAFINGPTESYEVSTTSGESASVVMKNENQVGLTPSRYTVRFSDTVPIGTHNVSAKIEYLQFDSNLAIYWSRGLADWQREDDLVGRVCLKECVFIAKSCRRDDRLSFQVTGISSKDNRPPTKVAIDYATLDNTTVQFSRQLVDSVKNLGFQSKSIDLVTQQREFITLPGHEKTGYFWVRMQSSGSVFVGDSLCE